VLLADSSGQLGGVAYNLARGRFRAVAITTSSYTTGDSITWVQGSDIRPWRRPYRRSLACQLQVDHVMASAALPMLFPAIDLGGQWFGDGGIRLAAPLSPAVHLGAEKIIAVSTRHVPPPDEERLPDVEGYPPPAQIAGILLDAIFLDLIDQDAMRLERFNQLLSRLPPESRQGMRLIDLMIVRPSVDLGVLAGEFELQLPRALRFLTRGLGTREVRSNDFLSLLMFQPDYLSRLVELGEEDARRRHADIARFLGMPSPPRGEVDRSEESTSV